MGTPLESPTLVYLAASNFEAHLIASELQNSGIPAHVVEDNPYYGAISLRRWGEEWEIAESTPEIYVEKCQLEEAQVFLLDHAKRHKKSDIALFCFHCGASFEAVEREDGYCPECDCDLVWSDEDSLRIDPENEPVDVVASMLAMFFFIVLLAIILFR